MTMRLTGHALTALRDERFALDNFRCVNCGRKVNDDLPDWDKRKAHLAHIISRGAGGSDTIENTRTKCRDCHLELEHAGGKVVARKL